MDDFKEVEEKGKRLNSSEYYASVEATSENKKKVLKKDPTEMRAGGREVMRGTADPVYSGSNPDLPSVLCVSFHML